MDKPININLNINFNLFNFWPNMNWNTSINPCNDRKELNEFLIKKSKEEFKQLSKEDQETLNKILECDKDDEDLLNKVLINK